MTSTAATAQQEGSEDSGHAHGVTPDFHKANLVLRGIALAENAIILLLLVGTVSVILAQIFFRYALSQPLSWSTEMATTLLVYIAFVGFAIGVRDNAHVALRLFERRLSIRPRRWMRMGELLVLGAVLVCIGVGGATYASEQRDVVSDVGIPLWVQVIPLPLGATFGLIHIIVEIMALLRGKDIPWIAPIEDDLGGEQ